MLITYVYIMRAIFPEKINSTSIIIIFMNGKEIYSIKNDFKNIRYIHSFAFVISLQLSLLRARSLYTLSSSKCKSQKSIHTAFCSRICTYSYRNSSYFSYYHRKVQPLVTNSLRKISSSIQTKALILHSSFALRVVRCNNSCYESLITYRVRF